LAINLEQRRLPDGGRQLSLAQQQQSGIVSPDDTGLDHRPAL